MIQVKTELLSIDAMILLNRSGRAPHPFSRLWKLLAGHPFFLLPTLFFNTKDFFFKVEGCPFWKKGETSWLLEWFLYS
jgi:hypothetical protein